MYQTYVHDDISKPNYIKTLKDKKGPAKKGNPRAQIEYATACLYGIKNNGKDAIKPDYKLALKYAKNLAEKENVEGLILLGIMQLTGKGTSRDISAAFNSIFRALQKNSNNRDAKYLLSHFFFKEDYKEISEESAINFLKESGEHDAHTVKEAMGELGILYYKGKNVERNNELALKYLIDSADSYPPANKALKELTKELTENEFGLEYFARPKFIYKAANVIQSKNRNKVNGVVDQLLRWGDKKDFPPAMHDYAIYHLDEDSQYYEERLNEAAKKLYLPSINFCASVNSKSRQELMMYAKRSIYFKSDTHQTTMAKIYKDASTSSSFNPGIYFRYQRHAGEFGKDDIALIEQLKLKAWKDGTNEEKFAYAICLENGFNGLEQDIETSVFIYKSLSDNGYAPAARNFAHFQEFGEFTYQDLPSAIKKLEQYNDLEAKITVEMMNLMLSDHPVFPYPYNHKYNKAKGGYTKNPSKTFTKVALMLVSDKEMIPNFKLADKILGKAKKKSPLGTAIQAAICGDHRAGKPNPKKADKLFQEAISQSSEAEIKELYAEFLISEDRLDEAEALKVDLNNLTTTRSKRSTTTNKNFSTTTLSTIDQLTDGQELYFKGYLQNKDKRFLERAASAGFPLAESEYANLILKEGKKKEYKKALSYLQSSSQQGIITSYVLLGYMYHKGIEVKTNYQEAIRNYTIAIEHLEYQGYAGYALAYCTGNGFDKDFYMANRYFNMAKETKTTFERPYAINYQMFVNKDYKDKFEEIKEIDISKINPNKASKAFTYATYYEFVKSQYQKAFTFYEKAFKLEPNNHKYKRNYAYFILKSIGVYGHLDEAMKYYEELGNADDLYNLKIAKHYNENSYIPFFYNEEVSEILELIKKEECTMNGYFKLGCLILSGEQVHQQYNVAYNILHKGAKKFDDPNAYYQMGIMAENGFGGFFTNEEIVLLYKNSALVNPDNSGFIPANAKGCFKIGTMFANGERTYVDLHQALFYLVQAQDLKLEEQSLKSIVFNTLDRLHSSKTVIDPWDEHLTNYYSHEKYDENEFDELEITDLSSPFQNWKKYDASLESSADPNTQCLLGFQYMKGIGVAKNYDKAFEFFGKASLQDQPQAKVYFGILSRMCEVSHCSQIFQYNIFDAKTLGLSLAYVEEAKTLLGIYPNIPKGDTEKAKELLQKAIEAGDNYALYIRGRYLDDAESLKQASDNGCGKATYYIGKMLLEEHKYEDALPIFEKGASQGHPKAIFTYGYLNMIKENKEKAEEFMTKGVNIAGNSIIAVKYGLERLKGNIIDKNESEAFKWFEIAHNMNNLDGTLNLAICYRDGIGCNQDMKKAAELFKIGCKLKIPEFYSPASQCFKELKGMKNWFKEKKYGKKAKKVKTAPPQFPNRIIKPQFIIDSKSIYNPKHAFIKAIESKMINDDDYKKCLQIACKLGLFRAVKEMIYQLISGLYFDKDELSAFTLLNKLIAVGWGTGYKILGDIYNAKEIFFFKEKTFEAYKKAAEMGSKSGKFKYGYCIVNGIGCDKDPELGYSIIDSSNCKYAYNYLHKFSNYKIKISKNNNNCLTVLEKVAITKLSFEYRNPSKDFPFTLNDLRVLVERDIKYGITLYNKYCLDKEMTKEITSSSFSVLKKIAEMGSSFANYQAGLTLFKRDNLQDCIQYLKYAADGDNYYACHFLGRALYDDRIAAYSLAKEYLKQSAIHLNDPDDQFDLAFVSDNNEAVGWLEMAAETSPSKYAMRVAELFRNGIKNGMPPNPAKAEKYFDVVYKNYLGTDSDYFNIGVYYYHGEGISQNYSMSYKFFKRSADRGKALAAAILCQMYEKNLVSDSFPESYYIQGANAGEKWSLPMCYNLAIYYYNKSGKSDTYYLSLAAKYFEKSEYPEGIENAKIIRNYLSEVERQRRQAQQSSNSGGSGGGLLLAVGIGVMLLTGLPTI